MLVASLGSIHSTCVLRNEEQQTHALPTFVLTWSRCILGVCLEHIYCSCACRPNCVYHPSNDNANMLEPCLALARRHWLLVSCAERIQRWYEYRAMRDDTDVFENGFTYPSLQTLYAERALDSFVCIVHVVPRVAAVDTPIRGCLGERPCYVCKPNVAFYVVPESRVQTCYLA